MQDDVSNPDWPNFCCVILTDATGHLILERRPPTARHAANKVTCLGGSREPNEHPDECIRRELREELGTELLNLRLATRLRRNKQPLAWFYSATLPNDRPADVPLAHRIPGHDLVRALPADVLSLDLARWHRAALDAYFHGAVETDVT